MFFRAILPSRLNKASVYLYASIFTPTGGVCLWKQFTKYFSRFSK